MPHRIDIDTLESALRADGLESGLALLNSTVPHRYTAIFRFTGDSMRNICLYDKTGELVPESLQEVPIGHSFCQFVLRDGEFSTGNSALDTRLQGHPYQGVMSSYCGVPLMDRQGALFGSLCHFDYSPLTISDPDYALFQQAAQIMPAYLPPK